jgi:hypothetical protein
LKSYLPAVICGPWLGIWMSQIAYKNSYLAIVLTLTCTTPLFVMPMLRIAYGYQITGPRDHRDTGRADGRVFDGCLKRYALLPTCVFTLREFALLRDAHEIHR